MPWFKTDDQMPSHPKVIGISFAAEGLWHRAGCWCASKLTDGRVPARLLAAWSAPLELADELVTLGLWETTPDGWRFHDWLDYQPSREKVLQDRAAAQVRMQFRRSSRELPPNTKRSSATPVPVPVPVSSENSLKLSTTATSPSFAPENDQSGGGFVEMGDPTRARASRGRARLNAIPPGLGLDFDHGGRWQAPLATISRYPDAEWAIAAATIARAVANPTSRGFITPQHIVDYWALYSRGETPGPKGPAWKDRQSADSEARKAAVEKQLAAFREDSERMVRELSHRDEKAAEQLRLERWRQHADLHKQLMGVAV